MRLATGPIALGAILLIAVGVTRYLELTGLSPCEGIPVPYDSAFELSSLTRSN